MTLSENWLPKALADLQRDIDSMPLWLRDLGHLPRSVPKYSIVVQWSVEDGEYVATSPEWSGLSALAVSPARAVDELQGVIAAALDACQQDNMIPPTPLFYKRPR